MRVGQIVTLKSETSRRFKVLAISDWDIVTVWDLIDKTEREFDINLLQRVRRKKWGAMRNIRKSVNGVEGLCISRDIE